MIIDNLKEFARRSKLSIVPGNHDMSSCAKDVPIIKDFIDTTFPGINFICDDHQPTGVYREGNLVAEHGNMYCLVFNARMQDHDTRFASTAWIFHFPPGCT